MKTTHSKKMQLIESALKETIDELITYHASNADFDEFDPDKYANTGSGQQAHGHGVYLGDKIENVHFYGKNIYTVYIPDPDTKHFLFSNKAPSKAIKNKVKNNLFKILTKEEYKGCEKELWNDVLYVIDNISDGEILYGTVQDLLASNHPEYASHFFVSLNIYGIVVNFENDGKGKPYTNYVIFDPKLAKIMEKYQQKPINEISSKFIQDRIENSSK